VVSVGLVAVITLVLVATAAVLFFDTTQNIEEETPQVSIETEVDNGDLVIQHEAGDTVNPEELQVAFRGTSGADVFDLENNISEFSGGTRVSLTPQTVLGVVEMQVIHEPSNGILYDEERTVGAIISLSNPGSGPLNFGSGSNPTITPSATLRRGFLGGTAVQNYDPGTAGLGTQSREVSGATTLSTGSGQFGTTQTGGDQVDVEYRIAGSTLATETGVTLPSDGLPETVNFGNINLDATSVGLTIATKTETAVSQSVRVSGVPNTDSTEDITVEEFPLKKALNNAGTGETVSVLPSPNPYQKSVTISTEDVTVEGTEGTPTIVGQSQSVFDIQASGVTLSGLELRNPTGDSSGRINGVDVSSGTDITIQDLRITNIATDYSSGYTSNGRGIYVGEGTDGLEIVDNTITNINGTDRSFGMQVFEGGNGGSIDDLVIEDNTISNINWSERTDPRAGGPSLTRGIALNGNVSADILNNEIKSLRGEASATYPRAISLVTSSSSPEPGKVPEDIEIRGNSFSDIGINDANKLNPAVTQKFASHIAVSAFNTATSLSITGNDFTGGVLPSLGPSGSSDVYFNVPKTLYSKSFVENIQNSNSNTFNSQSVIQEQDANQDGNDDTFVLVPVP
jgi:hypothetical protein